MTGQSAGKRISKPSMRIKGMRPTSKYPRHLPRHSSLASLEEELDISDSEVDEQEHTLLIKRIKRRECVLLPAMSLARGDRSTHGLSCTDPQTVDSRSLSFLPLPTTRVKNGPRAIHQNWNQTLTYLGHRADNQANASRPRWTLRQSLGLQNWSTRT